MIFNRTNASFVQSFHVVPQGYAPFIKVSSITSMPSMCFSRLLKVLTVQSPLLPVLQISRILVRKSTIKWIYDIESKIVVLTAINAQHYC